MTTNINMELLKGTDGKLYILPSYLEGIHDANDFMTKTIYENQEFFTEYVTAHGRQKKCISALGNHLKNFPRYGELHSKDYEYSPLLKFFFEKYYQHPIKDYTAPDKGYDDLGVALFSDFVARLRKDAVAEKLKKRVADWESKPRKNLEALLDFESDLFTERSRIMAVRLDLNYHKGKIAPAEIDKILNNIQAKKFIEQQILHGREDDGCVPVIEGRVALNEVQKDRKHLFTNIKGKPSLFKHLVGYLWVIEFGKVAGYHIHLMLFFDGSETHKHEFIAQEIGNYWAEAVTDGRGYFENCNLQRTRYGDRWALGLIEHWDSGKRENLRQAMTYFCKTNQMVQVLPYRGCRLFGYGFVHRRTAGKRGRPRKLRALNQPRI